MEKATTTLPMHALLLCADVQFLGTTRGVLSQFSVNPRVVGTGDEAMALLDDQEFDVIVVDWQEIGNLGDFFSALRRSKLNRECVLVAIVRDLLDLRQAFAAGVHFLIHKPPSTLQIERCLRAATARLCPGAASSTGSRWRFWPRPAPAPSLTQNSPSPTSAKAAPDFVCGSPVTSGRRT